MTSHKCLSITIHADTQAELAQSLCDLGCALGGTPHAQGPNLSDASVTVQSEKKTGKVKSKKAAPVEEEAEEVDVVSPATLAEDDDGLGLDDDTAELTLDDVIEGFRTYAGKHGREKAGTILK